LLAYFGTTVHGDINFNVHDAKTVSHAIDHVLSKKITADGYIAAMEETPAAADVISGFRQKLASADSFDRIRIVEATAAAAYFRAWRFLPVMWPRGDLKKIPDH